MPSTCVVPNCSSKIGGHKFPRDRIIREKWVAAIRRANFVPSEYSIVCKKHFNKEDYRPPKESVLHNPTLVLKKDSVPSKFSWNEYSLAGKIRRTQRKLALSQRCSVLQCKSASSKNVTLHTCPNQESVRKKWAEVFKVNRDIVKNMLICSQHFLNTDYIKSKNGESRTLKQNAVPSQKLPRSTRVIQLRKRVHSKKKIIKPKTIKKEEKMTEAVEEENELDEKKQEVRECRACLKRMQSNTSVCNIFQSWAIPWAGMESTIAEDLAKLANVEVSDTDCFSKVICEPCYQKLLEASSFAAKVRSTDHIFRLRLGPEFDYTEKVWPKPIQVDKNINGNIFQEMDIEIKQEIVSDAEYDDPVTTDNTYIADNSYTDQELGNMEIKIEPEEIVEPPPLTITINCTMSLNPSKPENKTLINGSEEYEAIISDSTEHAALINGTDHLHNEQFLEAAVKEEPQSEEEDLEHVPDLSLDCLLCTKSFNSVTGLKAHVIAQHSYKSVKRKAGSESPEKKQKDEYKCEICRRCFTTSTDLMVHETCHNKHSCYGCSRKFDTFKQLTKHRKRCRVPLSKTAQKPKTLDDVIRPVKEERLETSDVDTSEHNQEDSKDNSMKLHLEIHSAKSEAQSLKSETHSLKSEIEEVEGSAGASNMESVSEDCST